MERKHNHRSSIGRIARFKQGHPKAGTGHLCEVKKDCMSVCGDLGLLIGRTVRINRGGPEAGKGRLCKVEKDYISVHDEKEGIVYYNRHHIKSISVDAKDKADCHKEQEKGTSKCMCVDSFDELLEALQYHWVKINRGGPEKVEGLLSDIFPNHILLIVNNEILVIFKCHIRSVIVGAKKDGKDKDCKDKDDKDKDHKDKDCKDKDGKDKDDKDKDDKDKDDKDKDGKDKDDKDKDGKDKDHKDKDGKDKDHKDKNHKDKNHKDKDGKHKDGKHKDCDSKDWDDEDDDWGIKYYFNTNE